MKDSSSVPKMTENFHYFTPILSPQSTKRIRIFVGKNRARPLIYTSSPCRYKSSGNTSSSHWNQTNTSIKHSLVSKSEKNFNNTNKKIFLLDKPIYVHTARNMKEKRVNNEHQSVNSNRSNFTYNNPKYNSVKTKKSRTFFPKLSGYATQYYNINKEKRDSLLFSKPETQNIDEEIKNVMNCDYISNLKIEEKQNKNKFLHKEVIFGSLKNINFKFPNVVEKAKMHNFLLNFHKISSIGRIKYYNNYTKKSS